MDSNQNDYHISFFKPTTKQAKWNRNLVVMLVLIWAVAIFGFQFLLRIIEKPTPEQAYINYEKVWDNVKNENASIPDLQEFASSTLSVLGKVFVKPQDKAALNNALSWAVYQMADSTQKELLVNQTLKHEELKAKITSISDEEFVQSKQELSILASNIIGLESNDIKTKLVANELTSDGMKVFKDENKELIPCTMSTYLIHNQSFLTDFKFLGFPFHYFYTAVFLLILFVFLCWLYCVRVDRMNVELDIED